MVVPNDQQSYELIALVNDFICSTHFKASWILVAHWVNVCPFGKSDCIQVGSHHMYFVDIPVATSYDSCFL